VDEAVVDLLGDLDTGLLEAARQGGRGMSWIAAAAVLVLPSLTAMVVPPKRGSPRVQATAPIGEGGSEP
jgi:hypothetical protein